MPRRRLRRAALPQRLQLPRGASLPEDLVERAAALGYDALALGDRDGVYGAPRFFTGRATARACARSSARRSSSTDAGALWLLVEDRAGYSNLCRLLTAAARGRAEGRGAGDVGAGRGARGGALLPRRRRRTGRSRAPTRAAHLDRLRGIFARSARRRRAPPSRARRRARSRAGSPTSPRAHGVPVVATNDVRHARRDGPRAARRPHLHPRTARRSTPPGRLLAAERRAPPQVARARWRRCFADLPERDPRQPRASPSAAPSRSPTSATASPTIRCRRARRRSATCAASPTTARASASGTITPRVRAPARARARASSRSSTSPATS